MGRVSKKQAEQNHEKIVEIACRLFREHGVENVSIAEIMKAAGLTSGGFYKHFDSKDALIEATFKLAFQQSSNTWQQVCEVEPDSSGVTAIVQHYFKKRPAERNCPILSFASQVSHLPETAASGDIYAHGVEQLFDKFHEEAAALSKLKGKTALSESETFLLFAAMVGTGLLSKAMGDSAWIHSMKTAVQAALP